VLRPLGAVAAETAPLSAREAELVSRIGNAPVLLRKVAVSSGAPRTLKALQRRGVLQVAAFTPSDACHVLGLQANWPGEAAERAARLAVRHRDMAEPSAERVREFCRAAWAETVRLTGRVILETALDRPLAGDPLVEAVCAGTPALGLVHLSIAPSVPVVAVGAPVDVYYGEVGKRLQCEIVFPPHRDVANALGAATGVVARAVSVEVTGDGNGAFRVHSAAGPKSFASAAEALAFAEAEARSEAGREATAMGAGDIETHVSVSRRLLPDALNDEGLFEALVTAEALGRPMLSR
jgi:N-methylhydantoinase A/oxoprolinase/acetone carboxylase beta subunit